MRSKRRSWWNVPGHLVDDGKTRAGRGQLLIYLSIATGFLAAGAVIDALYLTPVQVTPVGQRFGWDEPKAVEMLPEVAKTAPKLAIKDPDGKVVTGKGQGVELWPYAKLVNGGKHFPTWRQESSDCTSMALAQGGNYAQAVRIAKLGINEEVKLLFPPFNYATSRVDEAGGQFGRGGGSTGYFAIKAGMKHGNLAIEDAKNLGFIYNGALADQWGLRGAPPAAKKLAINTRIQAYSQVQTWEDVRDAIVNGYPVTVASNVGFDGPEYVADGRAWLTPRGSWPHQMLFIGAEDREGRKKGALCQNSWGADWGPRPRNGEPPGSFWVDHQTVHRMVSQGDSYAISDFDGFPAPSKDLSWDAFTTEIETAGSEQDKAAVVAAEAPEVRPVLEETRKLWAPIMFIVLGVIALASLVVGLRQKHSCSSRSQSA